MPRSRLNAAQCGMLARINSHFNGSEPPGRDNATASGVSGGTPHSLVSHTARSWGLILEKKDFSLPDTLRQIVPPSGTFDVAIYIGSPPTWEHIPTGKDLPIVCRSIWSMPIATDNDRVRRLTQYLALAQMVSKLFGEVWNQSNERRKRLMIDKYNEPALKLIDNALNVVRGLTFLCEQLDKGCIAWLNQDFTDNFLANRITRSGVIYDNAMAHIRNHDLVQKIRQSGANDLVKGIESHLINVYRISEIHAEAIGNFDNEIVIKRSRSKSNGSANDGGSMHLDG
ncbi:MAG: hypothetical protein Q9210_006130 [Variospora velana]